MGQTKDSDETQDGEGKVPNGQLIVPLSDGFFQVAQLSCSECSHFGQDTGWTGKRGECIQRARGGQEKKTPRRQEQDIV
jgi:hypothetical protein